MAGFCTLLVPFPSPPPFPGPTVILSGLSSLNELHKFGSLVQVCSDEFPSHLSWYCHMFLFYMYIKLISHCYFCFMQPAFTRLYTHVFSFCHSLIFPEFLPLTLELFFSCLYGCFFFFSDFYSYCQKLLCQFYCSFWRKGVFLSPDAFQISRYRKF